ncbi:hypothetical protein E4U43_006812, partial [Claviceps pusilla]
MSGTSMLAPLLRHAARHAARPSSAATALRPSIMTACRALHNGSPRRDKPGNYARTDSHIEVAHPAEHELPSSQPVLGTGGQFVKPTLPSFSLDGRVGVVTGGARGLGLVMAQGMVFSGADVALVDMNVGSLTRLSMVEEEAQKQTKLLMDAFIRENPNAER